MVDHAEKDAGEGEWKQRGSHNWHLHWDRKAGTLDPGPCLLSLAVAGLPMGQDIPVVSMPLTATPVARGALFRLSRRCGFAALEGPAGGHLLSRRGCVGDGRYTASL